MKLHINEYDFLPNKKRTGEIINQIRKKNGLKISQFAEILSVDEKTVSKWISGYSFPNLYTLDMIRERFGVSFEELLLADSKIDKKYYDFFNEENSNFLPLDITIIDDFDEDGYAINAIDVSFACFELEKYKYKAILTDYFMQKYLFSSLDLEDKKRMQLLNINIGNERLRTNLNNIYGYSYKLNLTENIKNNILFEIKKEYFSPTIDSVTGVKFYNERTDYLFHFIYYLFLSADKEYHKCLINTLDDFEVELVYNGLIWSGVKETERFMPLLKERNPRKYQFKGFTIECNLKYFERFSLYKTVFKEVFDGISHKVVYENVDIFNKNKEDILLSTRLYRIFMMGIFDCIIHNNFDDFNNIVGGNGNE